MVLVGSRESCRSCSVCFIYGHRYVTIYIRRYLRLIARSAFCSLFNLSQASTIDVAYGSARQGNIGLVSGSASFVLAGSPVAVSDPPVVPDFINRSARCRGITIRHYIIRLHICTLTDRHNRVFTVFIFIISGPRHCCSRSRHILLVIQSVHGRRTSLEARDKIIRLLRGVAEIPVGGVGACQCAAAIDIVCHRAAGDVDINAACNLGTEAAAKDVADGAARDVHLQVLRVDGIGIGVCRLVAAAIGIADGAAADVDRHRALRCAVHVVAAEQTVCTATADGHRDRSLHVCRNGIASQAAAIEVAGNGCSCQSHIGHISLIGLISPIVLRVRPCQGAAAIDIVLHFATRQADGHGSLDNTSLAAAEGTAPDGAARDVQPRGADMGLTAFGQSLVALCSGIDKAIVRAVHAHSATGDGD